MAKTENDKALDLLVSSINKQFGAGSILSGENTSLPDITYISTGCITLDKALGGGIAKGRVIEIYGPESSGKTTITLHCIASAQKAGGRCAFIDAEHALDLNYAKALGVDTDALLISQPDNGEQALEIVKLLAQSGLMDLIVIDSVAALTPKAELEGEIGDAHVGLQSRLMSKALRSIGGIASQTNTTVFFINQLRMKIGVMYGNPETTSGGNALKFYASQRMDIRVLSREKTEDIITGVTSRIKVVKNKVAPPYREAEFSLEFGKGINKFNDLLVFASEKGIIEKAGAWYSYNGERVGQGASAATLWLQNNPEKFQEIFDICKDLQ
jgi:recombination protein RecA